MKTLLKILVILLAAAVVSAGFWWLAENTSVAGGDAEPGQFERRADLDENHDGDFLERTRPEGLREGGEHDASAARGLGEAVSVLVKITAITVLVLLVQKGLSILSGRRAAKAPGGVQ